MTDRSVILVTGAASGIGAAVCLRSPHPAPRFWSTRGGTARPRKRWPRRRARPGRPPVTLGDLAEPPVAAALVAEAVDAVRRIGCAGQQCRLRRSHGVRRTDRCGDDRVSGGDPGCVLPPGTCGYSAFEAGRDARVVAVSSFVAHAFRTDTRCSPRRLRRKRGWKRWCARWQWNWRPAA